MGIDLAAFEFLLKSHEELGDFGSTLILGRQRLLIRNAEQEKKYAQVLSQYRTDLSVEEIKHPYVDRMIGALGGAPVHFLDNSAYEGAQVIHDLNEELPHSLYNSYDTVIDIGTLEHVFNIGIAFKSVSNLIKKGGQFLCLNVANQHLGHGFWQFSPEAFFRSFCDFNGYEPRIADLYYQGAFHQLRDPEEAGRRLPTKTPGYTYITYAARKVENRSMFENGWPVQADYLAAWNIFSIRRMKSENNLATAEKKIRECIEQYPRNPLYAVELSKLARQVPDRSLTEPMLLMEMAIVTAHDNPVVVEEFEALKRASEQLTIEPIMVQSKSDESNSVETTCQSTKSSGSTIDIGGIDIKIGDYRVPEATRKALTSGRYEFKEREIARRMLQPGDRILELGAGMGVVSLTMAKLVGGDAVLAFEANSIIADLARENVHVAGQPITVINRIATPRKLYSGEDHEFYVFRSFEASSTRELVPGLTPTAVGTSVLEDEIESHNANTLVFDIEGFEKEILLHAELAKIDKIVLEVHPNILGLDTVSELIVVLEAQGLKLRFDLVFGDVLAFQRGLPDSDYTGADIFRLSCEFESAIRSQDFATAYTLYQRLAKPFSTNAYFLFRCAQVAGKLGLNGFELALKSSDSGSEDFMLYASLCSMSCERGLRDEAKAHLATLSALFPRFQQIADLQKRVDALACLEKTS